MGEHRAVDPGLGATVTLAAPLGSVTLMFTDIEGSTKLLERLRDNYADVLETHRDLMRASFERWGGYEVDTQGDSFFVAFASASAAVACAIEVQRALAGHDWPEGVTVRVRIGIHTGEPILAPTGYIGIDVHRGARIGAAAHGGQILVSAATQDALESQPVEDVEMVPVGVHRFKGLREPVSVFQVRAPELLADFPPIRTSSPSDEAPSPGDSPYKGLLRFDEADADRFFGREETIGRVVAELAEWPFLAVVGASGSGKSSLVRAGVVPALKKASTRVLVMTPTADPFGALAAALTRGSRTPGAAQRLSDQLHTDPDVLVARLRGRSRSGRVVLVVDQFEELFTLCHDLDERAGFIAMLMGHPSKADATAILVTLRADFYAQVAEYPALRAAVADHQLYIGPMEPADLRRAIEEPARLGGWEIAPGLVDLLLRDIGSEPGALPLLSHALLETWRRRRGHGMTLKGYFEAGEVRGAIARTADRVFERLAPEEQTLAREMLLRLTELGEGTQDTRRRAGLHELLPAEGSAGAGEAARVLTTLVDARLVTVDEGAAEVAHEALIREWPMLREWLREDREGLRIQRQVTDAAAEWSSLGRDASLLYRGARLATTREWAANHERALTELERAFLQASLAAEEGEALARQEQQERELESARRAAEAERLRAEEQTEAARRLRRRAVVLAGAVVLAIGLGAAAALFAGQASERAAVARAEANRATVRELANAADLNLPIDPELSILLALEAVGRGGGAEGSPLPDSVEALHRAVQASRVEIVMRGDGGEMVGGAISPDLTAAVTISVDGSLEVWDPGTGERLRTIQLAPAQPSKTTTMSFSPDGARFAVPDDNRVRIFDTQTWNEIRSWEALDQAVTAVVFSADGSQLATAGLDERIQTWDASTFAPLMTIVVSADPDPDGLAEVLSLAYMPDGGRIAAGLLDDRPDHVGSARIYDLTAGELVLHVADGQPIAAVAVSADGSRIATGDWGTVTSVWDTDTGARQYALYTHRSLVYGVAIDATGTRLATASADGTARIMDLKTGRELAVIAGHATAVFGVQFSADGTRLLTTSGDETARMWDISPSGGAEWAVLPAPDRVFRVAYSPDGRLMATGTTSGDVAVWDVETGEPLFQKRVDGLVSGLIFSADSETLFEGRTVFDGRAGSFIARDPRSGAVRSETEVPLEFGEMAISPDERTVAFLSTGLATIWDLQSGTQIAEVGEFEGELTGVDFSPDGSLLAASAQAGHTSVFAMPSGALQYELVGHTGPVRRVRFSPDGTLLVTGSNDGTALVWSAADGTLLHTLTGHTGPVYSLDFNPDGSLLATGSIDGTVKLWSSADFGANPLTLGGHRAGIYDVQFSPDGRRLISGSRDMTARVFAMDIDDLIEIAESRVTRPLNDAECQRYLHVPTCPADRI